MRASVRYPVTLAGIVYALATTAAGAAEEAAPGPERSRRPWRFSPYPTHVVAQTAGYVGFVAVGLSWRPAPNHDVAVLVGYVPEGAAGVELWQGALKYDWHPWRPRVTPAPPGRAPLQVEPLYLGLTGIHTHHPDVFVRLPEQYPDDYYGPTALHVTANVGTALHKGAFSVFLEFAALAEGVEAYATNREFFADRYPYWGLAGIGSLAVGMRYALDGR